MTKNQFETVLSSFTFIIILVCISCLSFDMNPQWWTDVRVGDVYQYCSHDKDDPFVEKDCSFHTVVAIKDGYVQYKQGESVLSSSKRLFLFRDEKVE